MCLPLSEEKVIFGHKREKLQKLRRSGYISYMNKTRKSKYVKQTGIFRGKMGTTVKMERIEGIWGKSVVTMLPGLIWLRMW